MPFVTRDITHGARAVDNGFGPVREPGRNQRNQPMIASRVPRAASLTLASAALLGILVFLSGFLVCLTGFALIQLEGLPQLPTGSYVRSIAYWLHVG